MMEHLNSYSLRWIINFWQKICLCLKQILLIIGFLKGWTSFLSLWLVPAFDWFCLQGDFQMLVLFWIFFQLSQGKRSIAVGGNGIGSVTSLSQIRLQPPTKHLPVIFFSEYSKLKIWHIWYSHNWVGFGLGSTESGSPTHLGTWQGSTEFILRVIGMSRNVVAPFTPERNSRPN